MKKKKNPIAFLLMLLLLICTQSIAEEPITEIVPTPVGTAADSAPAAAEAPATSAVLEPSTLPEQPESPAPTEHNENATPAPESEAPTENLTDTSAPETTAEPAEASATPEPAASAVALTFAINWKFANDENILYLGNEVTLRAEIDSEATGLHLQWQIATKPADKLKEDEPEWADIPGAQGDKYAFAVTDGMQAYRWRLCIGTPEGEVFYSDEMMLPAIELTEAVLGVSDAEAVPEETTLILPVANITFTAAVSDEEITLGTEITLTAEIETPQEGMQLQWQYMSADAEPTEEAWVNVEGATESSYAYTLDEENEGWLWRLLITVPEVVEKTMPADECGEVLAGEEEAPERTPAPEIFADESTTPPATEEILAEQPNE